jgi:addiction module RelE/StbE family toxin
MKIVWLRRSLWHMKSIKTFISTDNPEAASALLTRIYDGANRLATFPEMGRIGRVPGTRELPILNTPYIVVYKVFEDKVEMWAVFHGARRWPTYFPK